MEALHESLELLCEEYGQGEWECEYSVSSGDRTVIPITTPRYSPFSPVTPSRPLSQSLSPALNSHQPYFLGPDTCRLASYLVMIQPS